jgi:hypothetical protein
VATVLINNLPGGKKYDFEGNYRGLKDFLETFDGLKERMIRYVSTETLDQLQAKSYFK